MTNMFRFNFILLGTKYVPEFMPVPMSQSALNATKSFATGDWPHAPLRRALRHSFKPIAALRRRPAAEEGIRIGKMDPSANLWSHQRHYSELKDYNVL